MNCLPGSTCQLKLKQQVKLQNFLPKPSCILFKPKAKLSNWA